MIEREALKEIRERDFLEKKDYFQNHKNIRSELRFGSQDKLNSPLVTIVMPIYRHPVRCLKRALISALDQKGNYDYQILITDDDADGINGNKDIIQELNSDKILYYKNEKNLGLFANWNRCISLAKTEWITFLHSDDMLKDNFLETMCSIIQEHKEIDQLACGSLVYDADIFDDDEIKRLTAGKSSEHIVLRSVDVSEYFESMITSVKGAFIKREKIIDIGGFKDMKQGIGLSDYPAMLKYAYYYNTYLLDTELYLNGWGVNDTLNVEHWYPELIANYYMFLFFNQKKHPLVKYLNKCRYLNILLSWVDDYNSGNNFLNTIIPVDMSQLLYDCNLKRLPNRYYCKLISKCVGLIKKIRLKLIEKRFIINME